MRSCVRVCVCVSTHVRECFWVHSARVHLCAFVCVCVFPAPSAVRDLRAEAVDSITIRLRWSVPAPPNGVITQYRLQVLAEDTLLMNIIFARAPVHTLPCSIPAPSTSTGAPSLRLRGLFKGPVTSHQVISRYRPFWKSAPYDITGGSVHLDVCDG